MLSKRLIAAFKVLSGRYGVTRWKKRHKYTEDRVFEFTYPGEDSWASFDRDLNNKPGCICKSLNKTKTCGACDEG